MYVRVFKNTSLIHYFILLSVVNVGLPSGGGGDDGSDVRATQSPPLPVGVRKATSPYLAGSPKLRRVDLSTRLKNLDTYRRIHSGVDSFIFLLGHKLQKTTSTLGYGAVSAAGFNAIKVAFVCHKSNYPTDELAC